MNEQQVSDALARLEVDSNAKIELERQSLAKWKRLLIEGAGFKVCPVCEGDSSEQYAVGCLKCDGKGFIR